ncbi:MAG: hypothetical protein AAGE89_16670, partial [Pseudomonadota bacterium]
SKYGVPKTATSPPGKRPVIAIMMVSSSCFPACASNILPKGWPSALTTRQRFANANHDEKDRFVEPFVVFAYFPSITARAIERGAEEGTA